MILLYDSGSHIYIHNNLINTHYTKKNSHYIRIDGTYRGITISSFFFYSLKKKINMINSLSEISQFNFMRNVNLKEKNLFSIQNCEKIR